MKRILVINGNPKPTSLCRMITDEYLNASTPKNEVRVMHIGEMDFNPSLDNGYDSIQELEPDLVTFQKNISWAEHIVIVSPVWWGSMPAKLKGLFDRAFLSGFSFKYVKGKMIPKKLLTGRTSELVITLDTPTVWYKWYQCKPIYHQLKKTILEFCGIKLKKTTYLGPVMNSKPDKHDKWVKKVVKLAQAV